MSLRPSGYLDALGDMNGSLMKLKKYGRNLTQLAAEGKLPKCYAREEEIEFIQINRNRLTKPNILMIGPAGCGKTAIAEGLAQVLEEELFKRWQSTDYINVDEHTPLVFELSPSSLIGGSQYRGSFEERMNAIMKEVQYFERGVILFIDEIHSMRNLGKTNDDNALGMGDILKPALARGEFILLGSTTDSEYEKYLKPDSALVRRFNILHVGPINRDERVGCAVRILADFSERHRIPFCCENSVLEKYLEKVIPNRFPDTRFPCEFTDAIDFMFAKAKYAGIEQLGLADLEKVLR